MPDFDPDKYLSSQDEFDPDAYLKKEPTTSAIAAGLYGASQGLSLGYSDELAGGLDAAIGEGRELFGFDKKMPFIERYREARDYLRKRNEKARKDQPTAYAIGDVSGSLTTALAPGAALLVPAKGAGFTANTARVAGGGALTAAGGSGADLTTLEKDQYQNFARDIAQGAALNTAATAALKPLGYVAAKMSPESLTAAANERAVKAAIGQNKKVFKDLAKTNQLQKTGADLLAADEFGDPAIGWFSKAEDILPKAKAKKEAIGNAIGEVGKQIDEFAPNAVDGRAIAKRLDTVLAGIPDTPKNESVRNALQKELEYYAKKGPMSFAEAQKLKGTYKFKPTDSTTQTLGQDVTNEARRAVSLEMDNAAAKVAQDPNVQPKTKEQLELYKRLKSKYGSMTTATKAGEDRAISNLSNRFVSPSDYAAGFGGGLAGVMTAGANPAAAVSGLAAAGANKFARERGSAFAARTMDKLAKIMAADPAGLNRFRGVLENAARRGPQALMLTHTLLSEDPEYQTLIDSTP